MIDGATESPTSMSFGGNPIGIALNPASHTAYVVFKRWGPGLSGRGCSHFLDAVATVDTSALSANGSVSQWFDFGDAGIGSNPLTGSVYITHTQYVSGSPDGIVDDIGVATMVVGTKPAGVAVNTTTEKVYVANSGSNDISVIDGASNSVSATISDPNAMQPVAVAVNPTTNMIYVANSQSNNLTVIDGATGSAKTTIAVGTSPSGVAVDSQTNFVYVANAGNSQNGDPGNITVIDGATGATTTLTDANAVNPVAIAVNSTTNKIYVANAGSNNVTVIDGAHE